MFSSTVGRDDGLPPAPVTSTHPAAAPVNRTPRVRASTLPRMAYSWDDARRAFADGADWFVRTAALVGDRWDRPGLGEWDVRALVGHTSRSLLTVETYLGRPAAAVDVATATDYFRATSAAAA